MVLIAMLVYFVIAIAVGVFYDVGMGGPVSATFAMLLWPLILFPSWVANVYEFVSDKVR